MSEIERSAGAKMLENWMVEQFGRLDQIAAQGRPVLQRIAVISTQRSGSTWFCETLGRSGLFGIPEEWVFPLAIGAYMKSRGLHSFDMAGYLKYVADRTTTENGVFSINFQIDQYLFWKKRNLDLFGLQFNKIIYLHRRDKVAQAYSYVKAEMNGQWRSHFAPIRRVEPKDISASRVAAALKSICEWDELYESDLRRKVDLELAYEDFSTDSSCFQRVFDVCGIGGDPSVGMDNQLKMQRSEADMQRIREIKAYLTGGTSPD